MTKYRGAGVYVFRTRRPSVIGALPWWLGYAATGISAVALYLQHLSPWWSLLGLLFSPRHFAYVGESTAINLRREQHLRGGGRYGALRKPWSDLSPTMYYLPLPAWKWLLRSVETVGILLTWPVYNHQKNQWNPRRIALSRAQEMRARRDRMG